MIRVEYSFCSMFFCVPGCSTTINTCCVTHLYFSNSVGHRWNLITSGNDHLCKKERRFQHINGNSFLPLPSPSNIQIFKCSIVQLFCCSTVLLFPVYTPPVYVSASNAPHWS